MSNQYVAPSWSKFLVLICSAGLLAIWVLPGTIGLRHAFLVLGFIGSLPNLKQYLATQPSFSINNPKTTWPLWILVTFCGWLLFHLFFLSHEFSTQLTELRSVWARCLLGAFIGLALGLLLNDYENNETNKKTKTNAKICRAELSFWTFWSTPLIFIGFSAPCWITFGAYLFSMMRSGLGIQFDIYAFLYELYLNKPAYVVFEALILPLCFILLLRSIRNQVTSWWILLILLTVVLSPFGGFFIGSKNAMALFGITTTIFLINALSSFFRLPKIPMGAIGALTLMGILSVFVLHKHLERTDSWIAMGDNVRIGMDIDHYDFWKNREAFPRPINERGQLVDISTYERTAWFTAGTRLLAENPLGYGLVHHSFGSLALAKWPDFYKPFGNLKGATHSGWLDLALGVGIPGVMILLMSLLTSWLRSWNRSGLWFSYVTWTAPLLLFTYLIAEIGEGHFLELLLFIIAFFCGLTLLPQKKSPTSK